MKIAVSAFAMLDAAAQVEAFVAAEAMGYDETWLAEVAGPEAFALAGAALARTERMTFGVAVVAAATRTPALLAMGAGTLSRIGGGRPFMLGIGSSSEVIVEDWHGGSFERPLSNVRDTVEATRAALSGERSYEGPTLTMRRFNLGSPPAGPVPLYVAALGTGMLRLAGSIGDGVCLNLMPPEAVPRQLAEIMKGAADAGRVLPDDFGVMARLHVVPGDDLAATRDVVRGAFGPYFAQPVYNRFLAWCGFPEEAEAIAAGFAGGDRAAVASAMHDDLVDAVAVVGPVGRIRDRLDEYGAAGIKVAALNVINPSPLDLFDELRP